MKKPITPRNHKYQAHGLWMGYEYDDTLDYKGQFINGNYYGYWIEKWFNLDKPKITFFIT